jgi:cob(I)alamin adenosyltransferase
MRIYTRLGDDGTTGLYTGERLRKDDMIFEAIGAVDELNSAIGIARNALKHDVLESKLVVIQSRLFDLGAELATPETKTKVEKTKLRQSDVDDLECTIDVLEENLPRLTAFILPGGAGGAAELHFARTVARRAERCIVSLEHVTPVAKKYLNRLSDFLFTAARVAALYSGSEETKWMPRK